MARPELAGSVTGVAQKTTARVRETTWFLLVSLAMACRWKEGEERGATANHHALLSS